MKQKAILIFSLLGLLLIAFVFYFSTKTAACLKLECLVFPGKESWSVKETYEETEKIWRVLFTEPDGFIGLEKLSGVSQEDSDDFTKSRLMQLQGLFDKARSPYPGAISDEIVCQQKFKPVEKEMYSESGIRLIYYREYLNNRFVPGTCVDSEVVFTGYSSVFYCPKTSEWYQIELIRPVEKEIPEEDFKSIAGKIECQRPSSKIGRLFP